MRDSFGKNNNYLRISVTGKYNLKCIYCMIKEGINIREHEDILK